MTLLHYSVNYVSQQALPDDLTSLLCQLCQPASTAWWPYFITLSIMSASKLCLMTLLHYSVNYVSQLVLPDDLTSLLCQLCQPASTAWWPYFITLSIMSASKLCLMTLLHYSVNYVSQQALLDDLTSLLCQLCQPASTAWWPYFITLSIMSASKHCLMTLLHYSVNYVSQQALPDDLTSLLCQLCQPASTAWRPYFITLSIMSASKHCLMTLLTSLLCQLLCQPASSAWWPYFITLSIMSASKHCLMTLLHYSVNYVSQQALPDDLTSLLCQLCQPASTAWWPYFITLSIMSASKHCLMTLLHYSVNYVSQQALPDDLTSLLCQLCQPASTAWWPYFITLSIMSASKHCLMTLLHYSVNYVSQQALPDDLTSLLCQLCQPASTAWWPYFITLSIMSASKLCLMTLLHYSVNYVSQQALPDDLTSLLCQLWQPASTAWWPYFITLSIMSASKHCLMTLLHYSVNYVSQQALPDDLTSLLCQLCQPANTACWPYFITLSIMSASKHCLMTLLHYSVNYVSQQALPDDLTSLLCQLCQPASSAWWPYFITLSIMSASKLCLMTLLHYSVNYVSQQALPDDLTSLLCQLCQPASTAWWPYFITLSIMSASKLCLMTLLHYSVNYVSQQALPDDLTSLLCQLYQPASSAWWPYFITLSIMSASKHCLDDLTSLLCQLCQPASTACWPYFITLSIMPASKHSLMTLLHYSVNYVSQQTLLDDLTSLLCQLCQPASTAWWPYFITLSIMSASKHCLLTLLHYSVNYVSQQALPDDLTSLLCQLCQPASSAWWPYFITLSIMSASKHCLMTLLHYSVNYVSQQALPVDLTSLLCQLCQPASTACWPYFITLSIMSASKHCLMTLLHYSVNYVSQQALPDDLTSLLCQLCQPASTAWWPYFITLSIMSASKHCLMTLLHYSVNYVSQQALPDDLTSLLCQLCQPASSAWWPYFITLSIMSASKHCWWPYFITLSIMSASKLCLMTLLHYSLNYVSQLVLPDDLTSLLCQLCQPASSAWWPYFITLSIMSASKHCLMTLLHYSVNYVSQQALPDDLTSLLCQLCQSTSTAWWPYFITLSIMSASKHCLMTLLHYSVNYVSQQALPDDLTSLLCQLCQPASTAWWPYFITLSIMSASKHCLMTLLHYSVNYVSQQASAWWPYFITLSIMSASKHCLMTLLHYSVNYVSQQALPDDLTSLLCQLCQPASYAWWPYFITLSIMSASKLCLMTLLHYSVNYVCQQALPDDLTSLLCQLCQPASTACWPYFITLSIMSASKHCLLTLLHYSVNYVSQQALLDDLTSLLCQLCQPASSAWWPYFITLSIMSASKHCLMTLLHYSVNYVSQQALPDDLTSLLCQLCQPASSAWWPYFITLSIMPASKHCLMTLLHCSVNYVSQQAICLTTLLHYSVNYVSQQALPDDLTSLLCQLCQPASSAWWPYFITLSIMSAN